MVPKIKAKACPIRVDWLGGYFWGETGAVYIIKSPFKGMLVRYFLMLVRYVCSTTNGLRVQSVKVPLVCEMFFFVTLLFNNYATLAFCLK